MENVYENVTVNTGFTADDLERTIREMSIEQLLLACQLAGLADVTWTRRYLGGCMVSICRKGKVGKAFDFAVDQAFQIYEFPKEAHELLIAALIEERCK